MSQFNAFLTKKLKGITPLNSKELTVFNLRRIPPIIKWLQVAKFTLQFVKNARRFRY